jgi:hypothetical protein
MVTRKEVYMLILGAIALFLSACGLDRPKTSPLRFFKTSSEQLTGVVNEVNGQDHTPQWPREKTLYNEDYPIELALYQDGVFKYNLPRLGTGQGTWTMDQGTISLKAEHKIDWFDFTIDMNYEMGAADAEATRFRLQFADRYGPKDIELQKRNIQ